MRTTPANKQNYNLQYPYGNFNFLSTRDMMISLLDSNKAHTPESVRSLPFHHQFQEYQQVHGHQWVPENQQIQLVQGYHALPREDHEGRVSALALEGMEEAMAKPLQSNGNIRNMQRVQDRGRSKGTYLHTSRSRCTLISRRSL